MAYQLTAMENPSGIDSITVAACRWLAEGGSAGAYAGPVPPPGHDLRLLLARETGNSQEVLASAADWVRREELLRPVLERISDAGASVWAFKGFDLAAGVYPFEGARPMCDADLFVRMRDRRAVEDAFLRCGWSMGTPGGGIFGAGIVSEVKMCRHGVMAELHSHIFYFPATFPGRLPPDLFEGGRELGPGLRGFAWHNALLLVVLHMLTNSVLRPAWWVDVCLLCGRVSRTGTWREFALNAHGTRLGRAVAEILATARLELGAPVPERVTVSLEACPDRSGILRPLRRGRGMPTLQNVRCLRGWKRISWVYALLWLVATRGRPVRWDRPAL